MKWSQIVKTTNITLESYGYKDPRVKDFLRTEGGHRCVYCAINENALGGVDAFHVEHYRPKSKFQALENTLSNLFYSCPVCNRFKQSDWPAEPHLLHKNSSYPDPSQVDYSILFKIDVHTGLVEGGYVASKYMIERLYFNRPQLILERRQYFLDQELEKLNQQNSKLIEDLASKGGKKSLNYIKTLGKLSGKIIELGLNLKKIPSYEVADVRRKSKKKRS